MLYRQVGVGIGIGIYTYLYYLYLFAFSSDIYLVLPAYDESLYIRAPHRREIRCIYWFASVRIC